MDSGWAMINKYAQLHWVQATCYVNFTQAVSIVKPATNTNNNLIVRARNVKRGDKHAKYG